MKKQIVLLSCLPPNQVLERLRECVDEESFSLFSFSGYDGNNPVLGRFDDDSFRLRKRIYYRNSFEILFFARIEFRDGGSAIVGHFAMSGFVQAFIYLWFSLVALLGSVLFIAGIATILSKGSDSETLASLLVPPGLLLFGFLLVKIGNVLSSPNEDFIINYLEEKLSAQREM